MENLNILPKEEIDRQISRIAFGDRSETMVRLNSAKECVSAAEGCNEIRRQWSFSEAGRKEAPGERHRVRGAEQWRDSGAADASGSRYGGNGQQHEKKSQTMFPGRRATHIFNPHFGLVLSGKEERQDLITLREDLETLVLSL